MPHPGIGTSVGLIIRCLEDPHVKTSDSSVRGPCKIPLSTSVSDGTYEPGSEVPSRSYQRDGTLSTERSPVD